MPIRWASSPRRLPGVHSNPRRHTWIPAIALLFLTLAAAKPFADTDALRSRMRAAGYADAEVKYLIESGALRDSSLRRAMIARGVPAGVLESYLRDSTATSTPPPQPPPPTLPRMTPAARRDAVTRTLADSLRPFGYEIFGYSPTTFEPLTYGPVDPEYPLGPGDELLLTVWGDDQLALALPVSRDGMVTLPEAGQVAVTGLSLEAARARLRSALARVYSGLSPTERPPTTFLNLTLGKLRTIQVFIVGDVVKPGAYTVSSVSRVLNALYAAGGPSPSGSMRDVRVMRGGKTVARVDLYDVVLSGSTGGDVRLENGDALFVPTAGRRVTLRGAVRRPAIFELGENDHLVAVLRLAGGVLATADLSRAQIHRVMPFDQRAKRAGEDRLAVDFPLGQVLDGKAPDEPLFDLDEITVLSIGDHRENTVEIHGAPVIRPGVFAWHPGLTLKDLVEDAGGLRRDAFLDRAQIVRTAADRAHSVMRVDLGRALKGDSLHNVILQPLDAVDVASRWELEDRPMVTIDGMVRQPGSYELLEGMTLGDLLFAAGGLTEEAFRLEAEIARTDSATRAAGRLADTLTVALDPAYARVPEARAVPLVAHDAVFVRRDPRFRIQEYVVVEGELMFPGRYALSDRDARLSDVVLRAGGLTPQANPDAAEFARSGAGRLAVELRKALRRPRGRSNLVVHGGDTLRVPRFDPVVRVEGAVRNPLSVLWRPGMNASYYVTQASGYLPDADRRGAVVVQSNGSVAKAHGFFNPPSPTPGSRVVVPFRPPGIPSDRFRNLATIFSVLTGALTTVYLIQQVKR